VSGPTACTCGHLHFSGDGCPCGCMCFAPDADDWPEPVGEYPELSKVVRAVEDALSTVATITGIGPRFETLQAAITEIREVHLECATQDRDGEFITVCAHDGLAWPCPTIRICDRHGA